MPQHNPQRSRRLGRLVTFTALAAFTFLAIAAAESIGTQQTEPEQLALAGTAQQSVVPDNASSPTSGQDDIPRINADGIDAFAGSPLTWFEDYETARDIARTTKKPLFVVIRCER